VLNILYINFTPFGAPNQAENKKTSDFWGKNT